MNGTVSLGDIRALRDCLAVTVRRAGSTTRLGAGTDNRTTVVAFSPKDAEVTRTILEEGGCEFRRVISLDGVDRRDDLRGVYDPVVIDVSAVAHIIDRYEDVLHRLERRLQEAQHELSLYNRKGE